MRSVSSATWTRVLPVSVSLEPKRVTISRVFSGERVLMRRPRVAGAGCSPAGGSGRRGGDRAGTFDVAPHLLDEPVDAVEAALAAQPLEELEAQRLVVEIALEVQQIGLDQLAAAALEHRAHADVHRRRPLAVRGEGTAGVYAVPRRAVPLARYEVRRREAERPAALVAVLDGAVDGERRAKQRSRVLQGAARDEAAD